MQTAGPVSRTEEGSGETREEGGGGRREKGVDPPYPLSLRGGSTLPYGGPRRSPQGRSKRMPCAKKTSASSLFAVLSFGLGHLVFSIDGICHKLIFCTAAEVQSDRI